MKYEIIGARGVSSLQDYFEYRRPDAAVVMSATAAMWNPYLAQEIKVDKQNKICR